MSLVYNKSKCSQILDIPGYAIPTVIHSGMIFDSEAYKVLNWNPFSPFEFEKLRNANLVYINRQYALGDVLMLIPVVRRMKEFYNIKEVGIITSETIVRSLNRTFDDIKFQTSECLARVKADFIFQTDGILERDHSFTNHQHEVHRTQIYLDYLGITDNKNLNWTPSKFIIPDVKFDNNMKKIGLQIRGSGAIKTLPFPFVMEMAKKLSDKYQVVLLDGNKDLGFEGNNILNLCGKISVAQCISVLQQIDGVITMDSGMLWMAHCAKTPVVTFLGATREHERMTLHPLYPEKARVINMAEIVGCEPCFETRIRCKRAHNCMNTFDRGIVLEKLLSEVKIILGE